MRWMTWREQLVYILNDGGLIFLWWLFVGFLVLAFKGWG